MIFGEGRMQSPEKRENLVFHQDPVEDLLKIFDTAFRIVVPGPGRQIVGLRSISEKQNGAPGWYLWFEDHPGAYLLELADAETKSLLNNSPVPGRGSVHGLYRIKYYPQIEDHSSLKLFSAGEELFRKSDCFDRTGTPDFEEGENIPESFFLIGTIEITLTADANEIVLCMGTLDRWVTWAVDGLVITDEQGVIHTLREPGAKDRDVPAWEWSWFLLDRLILIICLGYRAFPRQVNIHEATGHAFRVFKNGISRTVPDDSIRQRWLNISFRLHEGHSACPKAVETYPAEPMTMLGVPPGHLVTSYCHEPSRSHPWIPSSWWHIRENPLDSAGVLPC
ncbi:MAG: hypothetical protein D4R73_06085 [Deltaproteobacteria bacterium]|nr:MAG: hypothetical protein D4R73_06085 [Deltaproteobacteria bacterium]